MKIECNSRIFTYPDKIHKTKDNVLGTMDNIYLSCCISKKHCMVYNQGCPYKLKNNQETTYSDVIFQRIVSCTCFVSICLLGILICAFGFLCFFVFLVLIAVFCFRLTLMCNKHFVLFYCSQDIPPSISVVVLSVVGFGVVVSVT